VACTASERRAYAPEGFAQAYQTLEDDTEVLYQMSHHFVPEAARGVRWDDPAFGIDWPAANERIISERDRARPTTMPEGTRASDERPDPPAALVQWCGRHLGVRNLRKGQGWEGILPLLG
jgi:hypothetical protein